MGIFGFGKFILLNILGCFDIFISGEYLLDGVFVCIMSKFQWVVLCNCKIGFVFQNYNLLFKMIVVENVELFLMYNLFILVFERWKCVIELLIVVGLGDCLEYKFN